jgi:hypothetical protein
MPKVDEKLRCTFRADEGHIPEKLIPPKKTGVF